MVPVECQEASFVNGILEWQPILHVNPVVKISYRKRDILRSIGPEIIQHRNGVGGNRPDGVGKGVVSIFIIVFHIDVVWMLPQLVAEEVVGDLCSNGKPFSVLIA